MTQNVPENKLNLLSYLQSNPLQINKKMQLFRANLQNATHFVGVAYPPNKISKTVLKMQAFYTCFLKFCLALNSYKKIFNLYKPNA